MNDFENNDDIDALLAASPLVAPPDFASRLAALARATPQLHERSRAFRAWQWASLGIGASLGALRLCEFVFVAFVAVGAH
jgi:hypothetical protein